MNDTKAPVGAHLVGSVNLEDTEAVLREAAGRLGKHVWALPDGETGERLDWNNFQGEVLAGAEELEAVERAPQQWGEHRPQRYRLRDGHRIEDVRLPPLGYAAAAIESYGVFRRLRDAGSIPSGMRLQVGLPTPFAQAISWAAADAYADVEQLYDRATRTEIDAILAEVPADELAIQLEVNWEVEVLEGLWSTWWEGDDAEAFADRIASLTGAIPEAVRVGHHLCYGDYQGEHYVFPKDLGLVADLANRIHARTSRRIDFVHLPVPADREDEAFFAPLRHLRLDRAAHVFLGLLSRTDGEEGAQRRIAAAQTALETFGVAMECGLGRQPREAVLELLSLHASVARPALSAG